ncbi:uncharacterized protein [Littorina saxatilis]|uniref:LicD/FKTN/FKRP nucleotidyltransferase domain-containing protein n=1 Tax=Littorina saxatilis TaxID=31220 RepID=A0AAN9BZY1_9CAEN
MSLRRVPKCCRCVRHIGNVVLFVCLFTGLNVLGYHYLYGPLTRPQFVREMSVDDGQQPARSRSQQSASSLSSFTPASIGPVREQTSNSYLISQKITDKSIPDVTTSANIASGSRKEERKKELTVVEVKATAESTITTVTQDRSLPTRFTSSLKYPRISRTSPTFSSSFRTRKATAFSTRNLTLLNALTSLSDSVTPPPTTPEPNCGDVPFASLEKDLQPFKPLLTGRNLCSLLETTDVFIDTLRKANVSFFMYGGTLIGSWRHHGFVPWDDDVDFAVPIVKQQKVYRRLMDLKPKFILDVKQKTRWKLYKAGSTRISGVSWQYPFLDINFYHQNATHVWDHDLDHYYMYVYPMSWVFPLSARPFEGRWMPAPRKTETILKLTYDLETCDTGTYNHLLEVKRDSSRRTLPCDRLRGVLPFVKTAVTAGGCNETLVQGDRLLGHYFFENSQCSSG